MSRELYNTLTEKANLAPGSCANSVLTMKVLRSSHAEWPCPFTA